MGVVWVEFGKGYSLPMERLHMYMVIAYGHVLRETESVTCNNVSCVAFDIM